ncbi:DUF3857 domain-containing transglutaminase family protein [Variovorax sp. OV329]|uniref:DUF3857 domain-containing transglutaminase family protein n=1 Tax=Variovorax sp. OV329 TaxID=1882825 RepID=UPI0008E2B644|nr:DUF3857 domain-containing protein [Variovorax sp. OV329]SFL92737.1 Transglutaminase-like superfamily protein [Variovorax sp. OV329]
MTSMRHALPWPRTSARSGAASGRLSTLPGHFSALLRWLGLLLALLACAAAQAQQLNTAAALFKVNRYDLLWRVDADASAVMEQSMEEEALSDQGAQGLTKYTRMYNKALSTLEVLEAYTLKADGRKLPVGADGMQKQSGMASAGTAASWPDAEVIQITFPNVQKGDRVAWKIRTRQHRPQLPGWASLQEYLPPLVDYDSFHARIEAPQALGLKVVATGIPLVASTSGTTAVWESQARLAASVIDNTPYNTLVSYPRLLASTVGTSEELVALFARGFDAKAVVGDKVRELALQITAGKRSTQDKAAAIHDWMRKNIRYVAVYLGTGGWVPHDVDWILANGYGDCKDKALLEVTLLRALGIEAVPVLISTFNEYMPPELANGFNHCIVYIPSLQLFADPTDNRIPFGSLPLADSGKPVALALAQGGRMMQTPVLDPARNSIVVKTVLDIDARGKAKGSVEIQAEGMAGTELQDRLAALPEGMNAIAVQKLLETDHWRGRGRADYAPVQREQQTQALAIRDLEIDNLLNDPQSGSINPQPRLAMPTYAIRNTGNYGAASRSYAMGCTPIRLREEAELRFDPAYKLLRIPQDFKQEGPDGIAFEARYQREGNTVKTTRELTLSQPRQYCTPAQYALRKPAMDAILKNLRGTVLFEQ